MWTCSTPISTKTVLQRRQDLSSRYRVLKVCLRRYEHDILATGLVVRKVVRTLQAKSNFCNTAALPTIFTVTPLEADKRAMVCMISAIFDNGRDSFTRLQYTPGVQLDDAPSTILGNLL